MPDIEDFIRPHPIDIPSMPPAQRKRVLWGLVAVAAILSWVYWLRGMVPGDEKKTGRD